VRARLGRTAEADYLVRDVVARRHKTAQPDSIRLADDLAIIGCNLLGWARWSEAEPALRECPAIREQATPDYWVRYDATSLLGAALPGQNASSRPGR
jgi:hypothetical protein